MATTVGVATIGLRLEGSTSLKDKRHVVRSLADRVRNRFNAAIAETEDLDDLSYATLTVAVVSNSAPHCDQMLATITDFIDRHVELGVLDTRTTELIPV
ncbi:MAG TPA: DUF503 domain-containing protein [Thermomicrobiales bacterium]|jgi:hypothetical protein|nr:DUF503 domain-containing protein [Thermomicrobiales bacterium]